ncbi:hypothetical protein EJD97_011813 [Solanum chilense]|uniref:Uncharacterized protein n=1 Tax=Solanum chilense TaxID=4083 RepID=A0A6N2BN12_SOLCI|nr:hypothetical protein EJD97_011813 [Solanum chilense]
MCYSAIPYKRERYVHIQANTAESTGSRGVVAGSAVMAKQCICSPTGHPGSFRCRHHHADYKWVVPLGNKQNHFGASVTKAL